MHLTGFIASTLVMLSAIAAADPSFDSRRKDRWSLTVIAGTEVGLDLAVGLEVETPHRLQLSATAGWMPSGYAWGVSELYQHVHDGPEAVANLLEDTMSGAFVARGRVGLRPFARHGFVISVGYTLLVSEKDGLLASEIESAGQGRIGAISRELVRTFETTVHSHMIDGQLGWQWGIGSGFSLRAGIGVIKIVHTSTSFSPNFMPAAPAVTAALVDAAERRLEDAGTEIWAPIASMYLGYTF